ncbi:integral membrane ATP-dependent zinc metallopeptidase [Aliarcobacter faecis]|uniref:AAA family ATPase n=1 Tax=Aliarcobacter faecis TaxID=1564138 RepID=UPI00047C7EE3|nr:AAA family ATPase [Aliarcobacter faecis]QKF73229.1 integral membrane ATP-dependent zinc metallopeptidase [Aliarcobacter faecis]
MKQDLNSKSIDKNFKLMIISALVLVILFIYTIYKSKTVIEGTTYYLGIGFLFVLLILAFVLKLKQEKIRKLINKDGINSFDTELAKSSSKVSKNELDSTILPVKSNISFKDVAGIKEIKEELEEIVEFLNNPSIFQKFNVKLPKGVLLVGPPGVGKTLIARAVAGEAQVPFFYQSGASFVHIYVGMGAKKVRELFNSAKLNAPSIVFIDEIDAIGKARSGKSNDERESTLNELLTQMDGFEGDSGVIVIAATNKIEVLDDALLRAGRFDRRLYVGLPNIEDRKKILELYLKDKNHNINIEKLAITTAGFNSASLSTLVNEALLYMIKNRKSTLDESDMEVAKNKLEFGKKQHKILDMEQKEILAIYQSCKAYISKVKVNLLDDSVSKINKVFLSYNEMLENIKRELAGNVGLELIKKEKFAIGEDAIKRAENIALEMVEKYKMATSVDEIIFSVKESLKLEFSQNIEEINRLKELMLKNEVINKDDL